MESNRSFTVVKVTDRNGKEKGAKNLGGRYVSKSPDAAARKSANRICRKSKTKGRCSLKVTVQETTQGSKHKEYTYKVTRKFDPVKVERNGVKVVYNYKTKVTSMN